MASISFNPREIPYFLKREFDHIRRYRNGGRIGLAIHDFCNFESKRILSGFNYAATLITTITPDSQVGRICSHLGEVFGDVKVVLGVIYLPKHIDALVVTVYRVFESEGRKKTKRIGELFFKRIPKVVGAGCGMIKFVDRHIVPISSKILHLLKLTGSTCSLIILVKRLFDRGDLMYQGRVESTPNQIAWGLNMISDAISVTIIALYLGVIVTGVTLSVPGLILGMTILSFVLSLTAFMIERSYALPFEEEPLINLNGDLL